MFNPFEIYRSERALNCLSPLTTEYAARHFRLARTEFSAARKYGLDLPHLGLGLYYLAETVAIRIVLAENRFLRRGRPDTFWK